MTTRIVQILWDGLLVDIFEYSTTNNFGRNLSSKAIMINFMKIILFLFPLEFRQKSKILLLLFAWNSWNDKATIKACWELFLKANLIDVFKSIPDD